MKFRSLIALAAAVVSAVAAPARAQQDPAAEAMQSPFTFGVESLRAAGLAQPGGRVLLFVDSGAVQPRVSFQLSNVPAELHGAVLPLGNEYVVARGSAAPSHLSVPLEGMVPPHRATWARSRASSSRSSPTRHKCART